MLLLLGGGVGGIGRADRDNTRAKLNADGDVVMGDEAAFAEADGERGLAAARVADAYEFGDVVPGY